MNYNDLNIIDQSEHVLKGKFGLAEVVTNIHEL